MDATASRDLLGGTRRKGEVTRADLKRKWPHHVALELDLAEPWAEVAILGLAWLATLRFRNKSSAQLLFPIVGIRQQSNFLPCLAQW